jgi:hypothetical protein
MSATFAAVFAALYAAHQVADHWVQSEAQAAFKGRPGWVGRRACAAHVATYTLTAALALTAVAWRAGLHLDLANVFAGLGVSAVSHYIADRRTPLAWAARVARKQVFYGLASHGLNGAYLLDQSWHVGWLFVAALVIA